MVEINVLGNIEARNTLVSENWIRSFGEPCFDFHYKNVLDQAFEAADATTALSILVTHILSLKSSTSLQRIMSGCLDPLLNHSEDFECFQDFFMALKPGTMDSTEESTDTTFARHLRNPVLP